MEPYTIKFETTYRDPTRHGVSVVVLRVLRGPHRLFRFHAAATDHVRVGELDGLDEQMFLGVLLEAGLDDLERGLAAGIYPPADGEANVDLLFTSESAERLESYNKREKHCRWQTRAPGGWICDASPPGDPDRRTTDVLCEACVIPDERMICPHLVHPSVRMDRQEDGTYKRVPNASPLCQVGNDPENGADCHLGGKGCAVRLIDTRKSVDPPADVARRAADEVDYFSLVYRDRYGTRVWTIPQARSISEFFGECENAEDFQRRVAALADLLSRLDPHGELDQAERTDANGNRVGSLVALERLMERDHPEAVAAVRLLRRIPDARNAFPIHTRSEKLLDAMRALGVDFPAADWRLAWLQVLSAFWAALRDVRVALQTAARAEESGA